MLHYINIFEQFYCSFIGVFIFSIFSSTLVFYIIENHSNKLDSHEKHRKINNDIVQVDFVSTLWGDRVDRYRPTARVGEAICV